MPLDCGPRSIRRILLRIPINILTALRVPERFIESMLSDNWLSLPVDSEEYTRINVGNKTTIEDGVGSPYISVNSVRRGFEVNSGISDIGVHDAVEYAAQIAASTGYVVPQIIKCIDFVRPDVEDMLDVSKVNPYTVRQGVLTANSTKGLIGIDKNKGLYANGLNFTFMELDRRISG